MGLISAGISAAKSALSDQFLEYFYCEALPSDVLMSKGVHQKKKAKDSNNIISNGSIIAVNEGQCMLIVQQGEIVDVCAEPGAYKFDASTEPSIFCGGLGEGIKNTFATIGRRFTFGGATGNDQRVYYVNIKEITGNKYGTPTPVPFRVVDTNIGLDIDIAVRCNGEYSYKIVDPLLFYKNVAGNVQSDFKRSQIDSQLKSELLTSLQPAFARISEQGIRYSAVPGHTIELRNALREELSDDWEGRRGIRVEQVGVNSIAASPEDEERIKTLQATAVMRDPNMRAANASMATADAMRTAAGNSAGAMTGFMGMNMAGMGMNQPGMYDGVGQPYQQPQNHYNVSQQGNYRQAGSWTCECGATNTGKFCQECGKPKPAPKPAGGWTCPKCGTLNKGKFCAECGTPKPADGAWTCECGTENTGKFCSNCGKPRA